MKAYVHNMEMNEHGCFQMKLYLQNRLEAGIGPQALVYPFLIWGIEI